MDLHLIENILAIEEEKSITRAAERRFITQSALNQQLQKLEEELGTPLFRRARSNWQPTEAGKIYLEAARRMVMQKEDAYHRIADCAEQSRRRLAVGLIPERGVDMFTAVYPFFHRAHPEAEVEPVECSVRAMQRMITAGELDLGLATLTPQQQDENTYHRMAAEEILLAVPAGHPSFSQGGRKKEDAPEIPLSEFAGTPFVRIYRRSTLFDITEPLFEAAGYAPKVLFYTSSNVSKLRIVEAGLACALLPEVYAVPSENVRYFHLPERPAWLITLCSRKDGYLGTLEQEYLALCRTYWQGKLE
ncbi:MAG: LysR family transcriptional regulator [Clostridia bacterium]|nr:LysR family transcriptional regulator [Clostridia bacterium]